MSSHLTASQEASGLIPRRIILSRKGFDSECGGCPSPIFPDGSVFSLPIPEAGMPIRYGDIKGPAGFRNLGEFINCLPGCRVRSSSRVHLDPDLRRNLHTGLSGDWRPIFGQCDAAQKHLSNQSVGPNDLFLFFGWFRRGERRGTGFRFARDAHDEHVIWGWLQIDHSFDPSLGVPAWARHHPHCINKERPRNTIYVGRPSLTFAPHRAGAGIFHLYHPRLRLTHPDARRGRSFWRLPSFFRERLTYHQNPKKWQKDGDSVAVSSAKRGQEFVFHTNGHEKAVMEWLQQLFAHAPSLVRSASAGRR